MRAFGVVLTALAVLGLAVGVAQAYTVTHNGTEVLFSDDMEGPYFEAEVGSWGTANDGASLLAFTRLKTGATGSGPSAAADGTDYVQVKRDATSAYWQEAVFTHPVSDGYLDIDFQMFTWLNNPWPQPVTLDNNVGSAVGLSGTIASILQNATDPNWTDWINGDTGVPVAPAVWNRWQMHVDLDADTYQISQNGIPGTLVTGIPDGTIGRVGISFNDTNKEFFLDAAPGTPAAVPDPTATLCSDDSYIQNSYPAEPDAGDTNYGASDIIVVKSWGDPSYAVQRKGYIKFDLSGITAQVATAQIDVQNSYDSPGLVQSIECYVLNDGHAGEGWDEMTLTWNNAPGNDLDHATDFEPAETSYLGVMPDPQPVRIGNKLTFSSQELINKINNDTDDNLSILMHVTYPGPTGPLLASKEDAGGGSPGNGDWTVGFQGATLTYTLVPEPGTLCLLGFGLLTLMVGYIRRSR